MTNSVRDQVRTLGRHIDETQEPLTVDAILSVAETVAPVPPLEPRSYGFRPRMGFAIAAAAALAVVISILPLLSRGGRQSPPATTPVTTAATETTSAADSSTAVDALPLITDLPFAESAGWTVVASTPELRAAIHEDSRGTITLDGGAAPGWGPDGEGLLLYNGFDCLDLENVAYVNSGGTSWGEECGGTLVPNPQLTLLELDSTGWTVDTFDTPPGYSSIAETVQAGIPLAFGCDATIPVDTANRCPTLIARTEIGWIEVDVERDASTASLFGFVWGTWRRNGDTIVVLQRGPWEVSDTRPWWVSSDGGATFRNLDEVLPGQLSDAVTLFEHEGMFRSIRWSTEPASTATLWTLEGDQWTQAATVEGLPSSDDLCPWGRCPTTPATFTMLDGSTLLILGTDNGNPPTRYFRSADGGRTWVEQEPFRTLRPYVITEVSGWVLIRFEDHTRPMVVSNGTEWYQLDPSAWRTSSTPDGEVRTLPIPPASGR